MEAPGQDDGAPRHSAPDPVGPLRRRGLQPWSTLQIVLVSLAGVLVVSGLLLVGVVLAFTVGLGQWASNK